ncbi:MAG: radical SAM protein [Chloroflexi bacterium]|nr:radical SAM protein [Chloroflexota bacterium]
MFELIPKVPQYILARRSDRPRMLPLNLVVSVCYRCNSRCSTCNVWRKEAQELTLEEYEHVFASLRRAPYYLTFSGGEPFLRHDLVEIVSAAYRLCQPRVITIPTNGILWKAIPERAEAILRACPRAQVIFNLSLDGVGQEHDAIRNVPGNYELALRTFDGLKRLRRYPNLVLGIHTVISRFNVQRIPAIYAELSQLGPDSFVTEIAEQRVELDTVDCDIAPAPELYALAANFLINAMRQGRARGFARITQAFRMDYYSLVQRIITEKRQVIPCYAGWASAHIAPGGDVWTCCTRDDPAGSLREMGYDFARVWQTPKAQALRRSIRHNECYCPMANASYTNMFLDLPTLVRVAGRVAF